MSENYLSIEKRGALPRMRTIPKAYIAIKELDPDTDFTLSALREMIHNKEIPVVKVKSKVLVNLDLLIEKLNSSWYNSVATHISQR